MTIYRETKSILENSVEYAKSYKDHQSYFVRSGILLSYLKKYQRDSKLLELGCGGGHISKTLLDNGFRDLDLVDLDNYLIFDELKALGSLKLVDLNRDKLPYENQRFDIVLAIAIMEHLENPFLFEREICRVLKRGGILILTIPYSFNLPDKLKFLFENNVSGYNLYNNHITLQTKDVFTKCWLADFVINEEIISKGFIKLRKFKIRLPDIEFLNKLFGKKICYILSKK